MFSTRHVVMGAAALVAAAACVRSASAQLVVGTDALSGAEITLIDLSGQSAPRTLVTGHRVSGLTADDAGQTLYWVTLNSPRTLWKAAYAPSGMLTPVQVGVLPSTMSSGVSSLAWDSAENKLIGFDSLGQIWELDTTVQATINSTLLWTWPNNVDSLYGAAFDPQSNSFYGAAAISTNFTSSGPRAIRHLQKPLTGPTISNTAEYFQNEFLRFNGLALGNGRAYLVNGGALFFTPVSVSDIAYNLTTNTYEAMPQTGIPAAEAVWAPGLLTPPAGTNLVVSAGAPEKCAVPAGGTLVYSVHIDNFGADASGPVTLTVDLSPGGGASFAGSSPAPSSSTPTQLTFNLPSIPGYGPSAYADVQIQLNALTPDADVSISATATAAADINTSNNSASAGTHIRPVAPTTASIKGILSTKAALANSVIPGGGGLLFQDFEDPIASTNGGWWTVSGSYNTDGKPIALRSQTGGSPQSIVWSDSPTLPGPAMPGGVRLQNIDSSNVRINNSGTILFSGDDTGSALTDKVVVTTSDGVNFNILARERSPIPTQPGKNYGNTALAQALLDNGKAAYWFNSSPGGERSLYTDNGNTLFVKPGVTMPSGASVPLSASNAPGNVSFSADGTHSIYSAYLSTGFESSDIVVVADGTVILKGATTPLPGADRVFQGDGLSPSETRPLRIRMGADGVWMLNDASAIDRDVVIRGFGTTMAQVFKTGDPIFEGSSEVWSDLQNPVASDFNPANTFFTYQPSGDGHFVIGGYIESSDLWTDTALVLDNLTVIARENDPVDLDGNGLFDDGAYIRSFVRIFGFGTNTGRVAFLNDHSILVSVSLRAEEDALCRTNNFPDESAIVRIPLPPTGACCVAGVCQMVKSMADCATLGGSYKGDYSACGLPGQASTCCPADFNHVNGVTVQDIFDFLTAWLAGSPSADFNHVNGVTVQDIFDFLTAWLAGC